MRWTKLGGPPRLWHNWFAWFPVTILGKRVWLEIVQRKFVGSRDGAGYFEYRNRPFKGLLP